MDESTTIFNENNYNFLYKSGLWICILTSLRDLYAIERFSNVIFIYFSKEVITSSILKLEKCYLHQNGVEFDQESISDVICGVLRHF